MKLLIQILIILLVVSTVSICAIKPDMHKSVIVYNSDYTLVPEVTAVTEKEEIPIMEMAVKPQQTATKVEQTVVRPQQTLVKTEQKVKKPQTSKVQQTKVAEKKQTVKTPETAVTTVKTVPIQAVQKVETQKKVEQPVKTVTQTTAPKVLTQQEEEIAWNIWRSNLQNKIMQDARLPILPNGTTFKFTFTVDKYGKVSNVQTWSTTTSYTPYAIQYIAPVIRSYQGKDILNFPQGSTRISTEVKGGWKLSSTEKYSTPQDYNDVEKVIK